MRSDNGPGQAVLRLHGRGELLTCMANVSCVPVAVCTSDFAAALDERIFDAEVKGVVLKEGDQPSLNTGRDVAAQCLVECLRQPDAANKVLSLVSVKGFREDGVACSVNNALDLGPASKNRAREVLTPSADEWKQAFSKGLP